MEEWNDAIHILHPNKLESLCGHKEIDRFNIVKLYDRKDDRDFMMCWSCLEQQEKYNERQKIGQSNLPRYNAT